MSTNTRKCKTTPYSVSKHRAAISPYNTTRRVRNALRSFQKGKSIGFTGRSSLKSMGLLPRSTGCFVLGDKYLTKK
jgi:predicted Zn-dependent protease